MSSRAKNTSSSTNFLDQTIQILFYILFFFTPLILWPFTSEVFEFNKMLFVYILTILIATTWVFKWLSVGKITIRRTPLDLPLLLFFISQLISTFLSIDPHTSFWGYYSRFHGGLASTISYIILYYALVTNFTQNQPNHSETIINPKIKNLIYSILGSAILVSSYGALEHFGIDKELWVQDVQNRVFSTLGQPNWLSAYLVAILPLPIYLALYAKKPKTIIGWSVIAALFFTTILYTKSRSGVGATFVVLTLIGLHQLRNLKTKNSKVSPRSIWLLAISSLLIILAVGTPWTPNPKDLNTALTRGGQLWPWAEKYFNRFGLTTQLKPVPEELLTEDEKTAAAAKAAGRRHGGSDSFDIRNLVWQGAVELGKRRPLFGSGLETFGYTYYNVRPAAHNLVSEWDFLYNKAHNEYLNFLANAGFVGLGTYLLLIFSILYLFLKTKTTPNGFSLRAALLTGFISILITNYFGFSVVNIALFFFLFPALLISISEDKVGYLSISIPLNKIFLSTIILLLTGYSLLSPINQFRADLAFNRGRMLVNAQQLKEGLNHLTEAKELNSSEPTFYAQLAEAQATAVLSVKQQLDSLPATISAQYKEEGEQLMDNFQKDALSNSQKAINMNKYHTSLYKSKAKVELYLGTIKPEYNQKALNTLLELSSLAPTDAKVYYNIGLLYDQLGDKEKAQMAYTKALELKPDYEEVKRFLPNPQP